MFLRANGTVAYNELMNCCKRLYLTRVKVLSLAATRISDVCSIRLTLEDRACYRVHDVA